MTDSDALEVSDHVSRFYNVMPKYMPVKSQLGAVNATWFIDDDYVLTVFRDKSSEQCKCLAEILVQDETGYLPKPIKSIAGYVSMFGKQPTTLYRKLPGEHFVAPDHSQKKALPATAHSSIANSFWAVNTFLARHTPVSASLGKIEYLATLKAVQRDARAKKIPAYLDLDFVAEYLAEETMPLFHSSLVHTDMERHNLLHTQDGIVTGVVDVDAIMQGDLLYEYAHFMMNFAFTDPNYKPAYVDTYMQAISNSPLAKKDTLSILPKLLRLFAAEDLFYYYNKADQTTTNIEALALVYKEGVERANAYFKV